MSPNEPSTFTRHMPRAPCRDATPCIFLRLASRHQRLHCCEGLLVEVCLVVGLRKCLGIVLSKCRGTVLRKSLVRDAQRIFSGQLRSAQPGENALGRLRRAFSQGGYGGSLKISCSREKKKNAPKPITAEHFPLLCRSELRKCSGEAPQSIFYVKKRSPSIF